MLALYTITIIRYIFVIYPSTIMHICPVVLLVVVDATMACGQCIHLVKFVHVEFPPQILCMCMHMHHIHVRPGKLLSIEWLEHC